MTRLAHTPSFVTSTSPLVATSRRPEVNSRGGSRACTVELRGTGTKLQAGCRCARAAVEQPTLTINTVINKSQKQSTRVTPRP
jgi:hypothetical protein